MPKKVLTRPESSAPAEIRLDVILNADEAKAIGRVLFCAGIGGAMVFDRLLNKGFSSAEVLSPFDAERGADKIVGALYQAGVNVEVGEGGQ